MRKYTLLSGLLFTTFSTMAHSQAGSQPIWEKSGWEVAEMTSGGRFIGCYGTKLFNQSATSSEAVRLVLAFYRDDRWAGLVQGEIARSMSGGTAELIVDGKSVQSANILSDPTSKDRRLGTLSLLAIDAIVAGKTLEITSSTDRVQVSLEGSEDALRRTATCVSDGVYRELRNAGGASPPREYRVLNFLSNNSLNMRAGPNSRAAIVTPIPVGERRLELIGDCRKSDGSQPTWCQVRWRGFAGWVSHGGLMPEVPIFQTPNSSVSPVPATASPPAAIASPPVQKRDENKSATTFSSGSAFFVSAAGHLLTNAHVVESCSRLIISQPGSRTPVPARVLAQDRGNDLALLRVVVADNPAPPRFRRQVRVGEDVSVFGYPLAGLIASSGNFTRGAVAALAGINDDSTKFQLAAAVQPGNSGGPVLDSSGNIVGVVVGKLNWAATAKEFGNLPEQINFAIKANTALSFLEANGLQMNEQLSTVKLEGPELAEAAKRITVFVGCLK